MQTIGKVLGAETSDLVLGLDATEAKVKQSRLDQYRIVYFATHGLVAGELERFSRTRSEPALALTFPDKASDLDDGLLQATEISALKLNADWVVLSACNTAASDVVGAEALAGLARAFLYAGARSLVVSHWPVADDATAKLMTALFAVAKDEPNLSHAEAMQKAMLSLIGSSDSKCFRHRGSSSRAVGAIHRRRRARGGTVRITVFRTRPSPPARRNGFGSFVPAHTRLRSADARWKTPDALRLSRGSAWSLELSVPRSGSDIRDDLTCMSRERSSRPTFSYLGGCRPGELSHSLMWEAVSARLAFSNNSSRSGHGGSALARSRSASACMRSLSSRGTVCLKRCRLVMTRSFPADKFMPIPRHAR